MVLVTGILGATFPVEATRQILFILAIGVACALILVIFVLPGILATFDRFVVKKKKA